jgi:membrane protease YdiL (CAAX protease family)
LTRAFRAPAYPPSPRDLVDLRLAGVDLPRRASAALLIATALVLLDYTRTLVTPEMLGLADANGALARAVQRFGLFLVVPLAVVVLAFRDDPRRYGLRVGDWRWGASLLLAGLVVMTPIIVGLANMPEFRSYYGRPAGSVAAVGASYALELIPAEFLLRGFLLFALLRRIGPIALLVVQLPFIFSHIGKPELELWSTFLGGTVFAWLDWRTGSILWSALGHLYILVLMLAAAGGVTG